MSGQSKANKDMDKLDQLSIEELEGLLNMEDFSSGIDSIDTDFILLILEVIEKKQKEDPNRNALPDVAEAWGSFEKNYFPLAETGQSLYADDQEDILDRKIETRADIVKLASYRPKASERYKRRKPSVRISYAALAAALILFAGTFTAQALGYDVWGAIAQWTKDTFQLVPKTDPSHNGQDASEIPGSLYNTLQEALSAYEIEDALVTPTWIPDRFESPAIEAVSTPYNTIISAAYINENDILVISLMKMADGTSSVYEKDDTGVMVYERNGIEHYIMSNNAQNSAVWLTGIYECTIYGTVSEEELKRMIDSIYEKI